MEGGVIRSKNRSLVLVGLDNGTGGGRGENYITRSANVINKTNFTKHTLHILIHLLSLESGGVLFSSHGTFTFIIKSK